MKQTLIGLAAASILAVPLAAAAHDGDRYRGAPGYGPPGHYYKPKHAKHYHYAPPAAVYYRPAPPRVVGYPVYVPAPVVAPAPVVVAPPPPRPWPLNQVDIGFRIFF
jgi:hypothetical protein